MPAARSHEVPQGPSPLGLFKESGPLHCLGKGGPCSGDLRGPRRGKRSRGGWTYLGGALRGTRRREGVVEVCSLPGSVSDSFQETRTRSGSASQAAESVGQGRVWREAQVKEVGF